MNKSTYVAVLVLSAKHPMQMVLEAAGRGDTAGLSGTTDFSQPRAGEKHLPTQAWERSPLPDQQEILNSFKGGFP